MPDYFLGLISGTSMDGIDAVVAHFDDRRIELRATISREYPKALRDALRHVIDHPDDCSLIEIGRLDRWVGECFRDAALAAVEQAGLAATQITAIGSHGQTLRHEPESDRPFSLQIGDAATIAQHTGIVTVADFRRADIAAGGQGAPLVPPFHEWLFSSPTADRVVLNIGGIANLTVLPANGSTTGFDSGPGNTLMDGWTRRHRQQPFDRDGAWAAQGSVIGSLLDAMLAFDYFSRTPPKSTGFEVFNEDWLSAVGAEEHDPIDVQATLCELTARSVADAVARYAPACREVFVCGGGAHNGELMRRLVSRLPKTKIATTSAAGLDPDWVEATAFAWLAMRTMSGRTGNLPGVTGASHKTVLGAIHYPAP